MRRNLTRFTLSFIQRLETGREMTSIWKGDHDVTEFASSTLAT